MNYRILNAIVGAIVVPMIVGLLFFSMALLIHFAKEYTPYVIFIAFLAVIGAKLGYNWNDEEENAEEYF